MTATFSLTITVDDDFMATEAERRGRTVDEVTHELVGRLECDLCDVARWRHGVDQKAGVRSKVSTHDGVEFVI
jgi:hypothetical protein